MRDNKTAGSKNPGRPATTRRRKKTRKSSAALYIMFVLGASMLLSALVIITANEVFAFSKEDYSAVIDIPESATVRQVAKLLSDADIIEHPWLFRTFVNMTTDEVKFIAGKHEPNAKLDYNALLRQLTRKSSYRETVKVTVPEGYEVGQIIDLLVEKEVCEKQALIDVLSAHTFEFAFLPKMKEGDLTRLQGYLFPDTYEFYIGDEPVRVIEKFLKNFQVKFTDEMKSRADKLKYSVHEIVTLASIIEREATQKDRALISSVFHNRLASKSYRYLESCATIQYALGERKARLTIADTKIDSPYNTYENPGLPPGPIASPGLDALEAALYPEDTEYLFFALQEDGTHKFSKTYAEHLKVPNLNPVREN